ncbi:MAG TPA: hypothetical protein VMF70_07500 [Gemmatimonadales bacterium]|nr:hypothetical protein [Gemmatimonadales bacterium]
MKRQESESPPTWYLMLAGRRCMVMPQIAATTPADLERQFGEWLDAHVFTDGPAVQSQQPPSAGAATLAGPAEALRVALPAADTPLRGSVGRRA